MKPWHISSGILAAQLFLIIVFSTSVIGGFFMLTMLPTLVAWGWTLKERSIYRQAQLETQILAKYNVKPKAAA